MSEDPFALIKLLLDHQVPLVVIGGHAVIRHGYIRATEDVDVVFRRSVDSEKKLLAALQPIHAFWIGDEIDPETRLERTHPVDAAYVANNSLMMMGTDLGFLDVFDFVPGIPEEPTDSLFNDCDPIDGIPYVSLDWLKRMKQASGRLKDQADLENLP